MRKIFVLLVFLAAFEAAGQILPLQYYTSKDGLLANGVNSLFQDSRGYLWMGTAEGVSVYDGAAFTSYRTKDGLARNLITCITESRISPGTIWIGTQGGGLNIFVNGRFATIPLDSTIASSFVNALMEDSFGTLWCGTAGGIYKIQNNHIIPFDLKDPYSLGGIVEAADSSVWIGLDSSIYVYSPQTQSTNRLELALSPKGTIQSMFADRDGNVWIGTRDGQLLQFRGTALIGQRRIADSYLWQIFEDTLGNLWICSESGLFKIDKHTGALGKIVRYTIENGLPENRIISGLCDREGNLWLGTPSKGLCKWANKNLLTFPITALPGSHYYNPPAAVDESGHFWVIAGDGLWEIWRDQQGDWRQHLHRLSEQQLGSVAVDVRGQLWVGFIDSDVHCYRVVSRSDRPSDLSLARNLRYGVELPEASRQCFFVDEKNQLWLSLEDIGVVHIDLNGKPKILATYTIADGLPGHSIRVIYQDRQGNMWFGGYEGGVAVLPSPEAQEKILRKFTRADGLPDEHVRAIHQDREGRIWIGTRDELMIGAVHGCGVYGNRLIWMAAAEAFTIYDFAANVLNQTPPPIHITRFQMNAQTFDPQHALKFSHDQNTCTIEFAGISLKDEKATRYQYRLLGLEPDWRPPTNQRAVTFAELEPGTYTFEVSAINNDGVSSAQPASITFTILPPFWQRWWFRILAGVAVAGILAMIYRYRVAKLLEIERTRLRIARDLHDEVGSTLSSISYFAETIRNEANGRNLNGAEKFLSLISESSSYAKEAISDIIWSIDPANDDWEKIFAKMRRYASDLFESKAIRYQIDLPASFPLDPMDMERRRIFWLLFKEMVMNAAKHAQCTEVKIELAARGKMLRLIVQDNGVGFDPEAPANGHGVQNIRARAKNLQAHLGLRTSPEAGTRWKMSLQI